MRSPSVRPVEDIATSSPAQAHFSPAEFARRRHAVQDAMAARGVDCLLITRLEDQYWLCGFDSGAASVFHVLFFTVDGQLLHLSRSADLSNIAYTSQCRNVLVFDDAHGSSKGEAIKDVLASLGMAGRVVGVETDSVGMSLALHHELQAALTGWCRTTDTSALVRDIRRVKSQEELAYLRRAGEILHQASASAIDVVKPGAFEGDIMAAFQQTVFSSDGEAFAGFPLGAGPRALLVRPVAGRGHVGESDQVLFEPGVAYRHYCATTMFSVLTGPSVDPRHLAMHAACVDALARVQEMIRPGNTFGDLYEVHRATFAEHGFEDAALKACGYSMGAVWETTWMEPPMIAAGVPLVLQEQMAVFTHMILLDRRTGLSMVLGETVEVTANGPAPITAVPRELIIR
ncbi:Xaa-Pro dipeptidase [Nocardioides kongjuensis]|uniref:Xaa-Pro dipeptidase n=1 Tax=Nocardioides kongjuensis TaxID=349522 RepID=A0A852RMS1_9ACTN|nr:Xaa-Pro dipeptidase [Nocardioides kongjuensis]